MFRIRVRTIYQLSWKLFTFFRSEFCKSYFRAPHENVGNSIVITLSVCLSVCLSASLFVPPNLSVIAFVVTRCVKQFLSYMYSFQILYKNASQSMVYSRVYINVCFKYFFLRNVLLNVFDDFYNNCLFYMYLITSR